MSLPDDVIVYPGHGAGSACGKNISSEKQSTIGLQKQFNYALQPMSQDEFVNIVSTGILQAPNYFSHDVMLNKNGYESIAEVLDKSLHKMSIRDVLKQIDKGASILDVRLPNDFETGFIPGSINIGKTGMFAPWVGTIMTMNSKTILVCNKGEEKEVISRLARIGYENIIGYFSNLEEWRKQGHELDSITSIPSSDIALYMKESTILDVRKQEELQLGHVKNSVNIPLDYLHTHLDQIETSENILIYCAGGYRSMIASSILKSKGYKKIKNIYGGFTAISKNKDGLNYLKIS